MRPPSSAGAWLPPRGRRRPPRIPPAGPSAPGLAYVATGAAAWHVIDRATGAELGSIWRTSADGWTIAAADGRIIAQDVTGTRHQIALNLADANQL